MALGFLKRQRRRKVIRLLRPYHRRFNDDNPSSINYRRSGKVAGDAHEHSPSRMHSNTNGCVFHARQSAFAPNPIAKYPTRSIFSRPRFLCRRFAAASRLDPCFPCPPVVASLVPNVDASFAFLILFRLVRTILVANRNSSSGSRLPSSQTPLASSSALC